MQLGSLNYCKPEIFLVNDSLIWKLILLQITNIYMVKGHFYEYGTYKYELLSIPTVLPQSTCKFNLCNSP